MLFFFNAQFMGLFHLVFFLTMFLLSLYSVYLSGVGRLLVLRNDLLIVTGWDIVLITLEYLWLH